MYDGIGSKKSSKHTVKEFLKIMNKRYDIYCSNFLPDLEYKPCSQYKESNVKILEYNNKHHKIGFTPFLISNAHFEMRFINNPS